MLYILTVTRDQLINHFTKTNGKLHEKCFLISLNDKGEIPVILDKDRIISIDYEEGPSPVNIKNTDFIKLFTFVKKIEKVAKNTNEKYGLIIQSTDGKLRANTIAIVVLEMLNYENVVYELKSNKVDFFVLNKGLNLIYSYYWNNEFILPF